MLSLRTFGCSLPSIIKFLSSHRLSAVGYSFVGALDQPVSTWYSPSVGASCAVPWIHCFVREDLLHKVTLTGVDWQQIRNMRQPWVKELWGAVRHLESLQWANLRLGLWSRAQQLLRPPRGRRNRCPQLTLFIPSVFRRR